jgi:hypothetical protein
MSKEVVLVYTIQVFWDVTQFQLFSSEHLKEIIVPLSSDTPVGLLNAEDEGITILNQPFSAVYTDLLAPPQNTP